MRHLPLLAAAAAVAAEAARPNIVLFIPDEMRAESMGTYGHPLTRTPNFDALAAEGTKFTRAFSTYPVCTQSRSSFLTGRYTHNAGHRTLWDPLRVYEPNLLAYAKNASYSVLFQGKNDALSPLDGSFNISVSESGDVGRYGNAGPNPYPLSDPRYYSFLSSQPSWNWTEASDAANVQAAIHWLQQRNASGATDPFFLYLPMSAPHPPVGCAPPFFNMYDPKDPKLPPLRPYDLPGKPDYYSRIRYYRNITQWPDQDAALRQYQALYLGCISYSDAVFGLLMDALKQLGVYDNTAVFVFSDHGDFGGDYGLVEKWPSDLSDVLLRVPLIAKVPGGVTNQSVEALVQHMDVTPTVLDLMGVAAQHVHYAVSQLPVLLGQAPPDDARVAFAEGGYSTHEPRDFEGDCSDPLKAGDCNITSVYYPKAYQEWNEKLTVCRSAMVRTQQYKLVRRSDPLDADHDSELYDLVADPQELVNQYNNASYATVRAALSEMMLTWYLQTADVTPWDEVPRNTPTGNWSAARYSYTPLRWQRA